MRVASLDNTNARSARRLPASARSFKWALFALMIDTYATLRAAFNRMHPANSRIPAILSFTDIYL